MADYKQIRVERTQDGTVIAYRRFNVSALCVVPLVVAYLGFRVYRALLQHPEVMAFLSGRGSPYGLAVSAALAGVLLWVLGFLLVMLFGKCTLTVGWGKGVYRSGLGPFSRTRVFEMPRDTKVEPAIVRRKDAVTCSVRLTNPWNGQEQKVFTDCNVGECAYLTEQIGRALHA